MLCIDGICGLSLVEIQSDRAEVTPFEEETHSTRFSAEPIALLKASAVDEFLLDDISYIISQYPHAAAISKLDELFRSSGIYYVDNKMGECPVALPLR
ncbi:MAG: hypothetical protein K2N91_08350 [Muribaculaceae bacterium]|nr:hypothetical protein [Muribaculaceae bacterium]